MLHRHMQRQSLISELLVAEYDGVGKRGDRFSLRECGDAILFQIEYEQLDNKEVKECLGKLENHQELVYIT